MQVESQLRKLLISILTRHGLVRINNIGTIYLKDCPAEIDHETGIISPPSKALSIRPSQGEDPKLFEQALNDGLLDDASLIVLEHHIKDKLTQLTSTGTIYLDGLGEISRTSDGRLHLTPSTTHQYFSGFGLPRLELSQIISVEQSTQELLPKPSQKEEMLVEKSSVGTVIPQKDTEGSSPTQWLLPVLILIGGLLLMVVMFRYCQEDIDPGVLITEDADDLSLPTSGETPITITEDSTDIFNNPILNKYQDILTQDILDQGCLIVVGSFEDMSNVQSMHERVISLGYEPYLIEYDEGTRVSVTFNCLEHDLLEYLREIRAQLSPKAWYYSPQWEPDI